MPLLPECPGCEDGRKLSPGWDCPICRRFIPVSWTQRVDLARIQKVDFLIELEMRDGIHLTEPNEKIRKAGKVWYRISGWDWKTTGRDPAAFFELIALAETSEDSSDFEAKMELDLKKLRALLSDGVVEPWLSNHPIPKPSGAVARS